MIKYFYLCSDCGIPILSDSIKDIKRRETGKCYFCIRNYGNYPNWKEKPCYRTIHKYIQRHKPKQKYCEKCGCNKKSGLAKISKLYTKNINDYIWTCKICHAGLDYKESLRMRDIFGRYVSKEVKNVV